MGETTIQRSDCPNLLPTLSANSAAIVLPDPPCLARHRDRSGRMVSDDDNDRWLVPAFALLHRVAQQQLQRQLLRLASGCPGSEGRSAPVMP